jgi:hypothetical protein
MKSSFSYACSDYPGMQACPGRLRAATKDELWKLIELHASIAHGEDPAAWKAEDRSQMEALIKVEYGSS